MEGQTFLSALSNAHDVSMEVNRSNVAAVRLLSEGRAPEAEQVLRHALNRDHRQAAGKAFLQAYQLDPNSAFTLNNLGYLAEMDGDLETAQVFYEKARMAQNAKDRVGLATRQSAEGLKLFQVAEDSNQSVGVKIGEQSAARRRETGPIELKRRDGKPVDEPSTPDATQPAIPPN